MLCAAPPVTHFVDAFPDARITVVDSPSEFEKRSGSRVPLLFIRTFAQSRQIGIKQVKYGNHTHKRVRLWR